MSAPRDRDGWPWYPRPRPRRGPFWWFLRHRTELTASLVVPAVPALVWWEVGPVNGPAALAALLTSCATLLAVPYSREVLSGQTRRIVVERRLRAAFVETGPFTWTGNVPTILRSAAREHGTKVVVWVPAGLTVEDLQRERRALASACFVDEIRVERHPSWANVAVLTVLRWSSPPLADPGPPLAAG